MKVAILTEIQKYSSTVAMDGLLLKEVHQHTFYKNTKVQTLSYFLLFTQIQCLMFILSHVIRHKRLADYRDNLTSVESNSSCIYTTYTAPN